MLKCLLNDHNDQSSAQEFLTVTFLKAVLCFLCYNIHHHEDRKPQITTTNGFQHELSVVFIKCRHCDQFKF